MKNILIVEDSATYRELLCKVLKGKGYKVKGVGSVKSALDEIKKDIYDFICTDYNLPDDTGTALLQHEFTKNRFFTFFSGILIKEQTCTGQQQLDYEPRRAC